MRVLLFGASGGLGAALAREYRGLGFGVSAPDRRLCDFADPASLDRFLCKAGPADLCLVCAGVSEAGYVDELEPEAFARCFQVNFFAPAAILSKLDCGRFVFILSGTADLLVPGLSPYALSKRALRDYLRISAMEGSFPGKRVLEVWPGGIDTDFNKKTRLHGGFKPYVRRAGLRSAEEVARRIVAAERGGKKRLVLSPLVRAAGWLQDLAPDGVSRLARFAARPRAPKS